MAGRAKSVWVAAVMIVLFLSMVAAAAVWLHDERVRDCETRAAAREDLRSMWVWALDQNPSARIHDEAEDQLNMRLPRLGCDGSKTVVIAP